MPHYTVKKAGYKLVSTLSYRIRIVVAIRSLISHRLYQHYTHTYINGKVLGKLITHLSWLQQTFLH